MKTRMTHDAQNFTVGTVSIRQAGIVAEVTTFATVQFQMNGHITVSGLRYDDTLAKRDTRWVIVKRSHRRLWEYEAVAVTRPISRSGGPL
jgi:hypothetical protein